MPMPANRIQRRAPLTEWPMPGISTSTSRTTASASNGRAIFSSHSVRIVNITAANAEPTITSVNCRSR
jgi:hypothetical protein